MFANGFSALQKIADGVALVANAVGTSVIIILVAVINYDVIARGAFGKPFLGAVEVVQFSMVLIVFLQLPDVIRVGKLTRSDGFLLLMDKHRPKVGKWQRRVIDAVSGVFMTIVAVAIWPEFVQMWGTNDYFGVPGVFTAPWWPIKLVIFLSACLCALLFALKVIIPKTGSGGSAGHREPNSGDPSGPGVSGKPGNGAERAT